MIVKYNQRAGVNEQIVTFHALHTGNNFFYETSNKHRCHHHHQSGPVNPQTYTVGKNNIVHTSKCTGVRTQSLTNTPPIAPWAITYGVSGEELVP